MEDGTAYIQLNAMRRDEYAIESSDADWPTIGIYVPTVNSNVSPAPEPVFTVPSIFMDPFPSQTLPSTYNDLLALSRINRQLALNTPPDSPPTRFQKLRRKLSELGRGDHGCGN